MLLFPLRVDSLFRQLPFANWVLLGATVAAFFVSVSYVGDDTLGNLVLDGFRMPGLLTHLFLHGGLIHLAGNMIFLWVFGNIVCGNTSNLVYPFLYLAFGVAAGVAHIVFSGGAAVGASGAINGLVGMALAMYPKNEVTMWYFFYLRAGTFRISLWALALVWLAFDLFGAFMLGNVSNVAYWAHIGGFFAGLATGMIALRLGWVTLTEYDNESLLEVFQGKRAEERQAQIKAQRAAELRAEREAFLAEHPDPQASENFRTVSGAGLSDPTVMPMTLFNLQRWTQTVRQTPVPEEDHATIAAGGEAGWAKRFEVIYARAFFALGFSFHRSLHHYYEAVSRGDFWPHENAALAQFLGMVESEFPEMRACGFIDDELAASRDEPRLAHFIA
ncbi:putative membrane protein [Opitutaceae bacterium TAV1]|nr:putative membrane protein [Opitutaceae bacterium TAV1]